jgi:hypothetical protein
MCQIILDNQVEQTNGYVVWTDYIQMTSLIVFFSSLKKEFGKKMKVATIKKKEHGTVKIIVLIYALNELTKL